MAVIERFGGCCHGVSVVYAGRKAMLAGPGMMVEYSGGSIGYRIFRRDGCIVREKAKSGINTATKVLLLLAREGKNTGVYLCPEILLSG